MTRPAVPGVDLDLRYGRDTLRNIHKLWTRPVHLRTLIDAKERIWSYDGQEFKDVSTS